MHSPSDLQESKQLTAQLKASQLYQDYEAAFCATTGMPLTLRPLDSLQLAHSGRKNENPFCALLAKSNHSCAGCLILQHRAETEAQDGPKSLSCFAGLSDTAVPIRVGERVLAYLHTGQVLLHKPSESEFRATLRQLEKWGTELDIQTLEAAYFATRVMTKNQHESVVRLLHVFAQHLSTIANQLVIARQHEEPPQISRARAFIAEHCSDDISLKEVADAVNMSGFYFCKMFRKATHITFTEYVARSRVEKVKNVLLNPNKRISEAAFEAGFQSLSQFNRVFRKIEGIPPTEYRATLPHERSHAA